MSWRCILSAMTLDALIMLADAFVLIEPQLGFPTTWDTILLFIAGAFILGLGIAVRRRGLREPVQVESVVPQPETQASQTPRVQ